MYYIREEACTPVPNVVTGGSKVRFSLCYTCARLNPASKFTLGVDSAVRVSVKSPCAQASNDQLSQRHLESILHLLCGSRVSLKRSTPRPWCFCRKGCLILPPQCCSPSSLKYIIVARFWTQQISLRTRPHPRHHGPEFAPVVRETRGFPLPHSSRQITLLHVL